MARRTAILTVLVALVASAREARADGVDFGISLTATDWAKLLALAGLVVVVGVATLWRIGKVAGAVRRERQRPPSLPTARLHREDGSAATGSESRAPADPVATTPERP